MEYTAPEIVIQAKDMKKRELHQGDVWSLGIIILELCLLKPEPIMKKLNRKEIIEHLQANLLEVYKIYGRDLADILTRMLVLDPEQRLSFTEIRHLLETKYEVYFSLKEFIITNSRVLIP